MSGSLIDTIKKAYSLRPIDDQPAEVGSSGTGESEAKDEPLPPKPGDDNKEAVAAAYGAAVAHVINRPDGIRARAQVSATISAAVAAALAAFAPLIGLGQREWWLRLLVAAAVVAWLVSLWRYILVIAFSGSDIRSQDRETLAKPPAPTTKPPPARPPAPTTKPPPTKPSAQTTTEAAKAIHEHLREFISYAARMRARVERGTAATQLALAVTLIAVVALVAEAIIVGPEKTSNVWLTKQGVVAVGRACTQAIDASIQVKARPSDLSLSVIPLHFEPDTCEDNGAVVHVRRGWIEAIRQPD